MNVVSAMSAQGQREPAPEVVLLVDERRRGPTDVGADRPRGPGVARTWPTRDPAARSSGSGRDDGREPAAAGALVAGRRGRAAGLGSVRPRPRRVRSPGHDPAAAESDGCRRRPAGDGPWRDRRRWCRWRWRRTRSRRASPTWRAGALVGSTRSSGVPKWTCRKGRPRPRAGAARRGGRRHRAAHDARRDPAPERRLGLAAAGPAAAPSGTAQRH